MIEIIKYPDGQLNVKANGIEGKLFHRINSYEDLIVLKSIADSPSVDTSKIDLFIPCLFGVGSYSMGYATRDQQGGAVKSTCVQINGKLMEIFKDPITDDGTKKSAKGLLRVDKVGNKFILKDQCTWEEEAGGELRSVYD